MKISLRRVLTIILLAPLLFVSSIFANEEITEERITLFKSDVVLEQSTDIRIVEEIHYFFSEPRRGIIREIPTNYIVKGFKRPTKLLLEDLYYYSVDDIDLVERTYERSTKNGYEIFQIGNPDIYLEGEYVYILKYVLKNAINYFDSHDELSLNITGNENSVAIQHLESSIHVPGKITDKICFVGIAGGTDTALCNFEQISDKEVLLTVDTPLEAYNGVSVGLKMPKGTLEDIRGKQRIAFLLSNIGILLPIPVFFFLMNLVKKKGKNRKITVIPYYEPMKNIYPLLGGYIYSNKLLNKFLTAEIIQLALDGYIKIKQEGKNKYTLIQQKDTHSNPIMNTLLTGLFVKGKEIEIKKLPTTFYSTVSSVDSLLKKELFEKQYYEEQRRKLKSSLSSFGVLVMFLSFLAFSFFMENAAVGWFWGILISSILLLIYSSKVDLKSSKGNKVYYELEGLKMYINTAEKHRIEFHNDPKKYIGIFEKLLPYAIIFGLEKKWASEFKDIYKEPPTWYEGDISSFNSYMLASSISNMNRTIQTKSSPPGSSRGFSSSHSASGGSAFSGGSSGGGFGGGGTRSW